MLNSLQGRGIHATYSPLGDAAPGINRFPPRDRQGRNGCQGAKDASFATPYIWPNSRCDRRNRPAGVEKLVQDEGSGYRSMPQGVAHLGPPMQRRLDGHRNGINISGFQSAYCQTAADGVSGEGTCMFNPGEPLLFDRGNQLAALHHAGGRVVEEIVDAEDIHAIQLLNSVRTCWMPAGSTDVPVMQCFTPRYSCNSCFNCRTS